MIHAENKKPLEISKSMAIDLAILRAQLLVDKVFDDLELEYKEGENPDGNTTFRQPQKPVQSKEGAYP